MSQVREKESIPLSRKQGCLRGDAASTESGGPGWGIRHQVWFHRLDLSLEGRKRVVCFCKCEFPELQREAGRSPTDARGIHVHLPPPPSQQLKRSTCTPAAGSIFSLNRHSSWIISPLAPPPQPPPDPSQAGGFSPCLFLWSWGCRSHGATDHASSAPLSPVQKAQLTPMSSGAVRGAARGAPRALGLRLVAEARWAV